MIFHKDMLLLYAVSDSSLAKRQTLYSQIEEALKGGVTMVQLREKHLSGQALVETAVRLKELCHSYHVPLIINDNVEAALKSGADGVHVGLEDEPVAAIRARAPRPFIIGATAKTAAQARDAERAGADYLGVGAVFPSPTKKDAVRITKEQLREICDSVSIPAVAIGGISAGNMMELQGGGMRGIAVVSALFSAEDIKGTAAELKKKAKELAG